MSDKMKFFSVGVFVFCALIAVGWLFLFLRPSLGDGKKYLHVRFSNIEKITVGTRVTFAGRPVGEVAEINEIYDARSKPADAMGNPYFFELVLRVDSRIKVYSSDEIIFSTSGLLGERTVAIIPKAPVPGEPLPHEITTNTLYARSTDPLTETLHQMKDVALHFDSALSKFVTFFDENKEEFHHALTSLGSASDEIRNFISKANETNLIGKMSIVMEKAETVLDQVVHENLVPRMSSTFDQASCTFRELYNITSQFASGEGTLSRLLYSDQVYLQLSGVMGYLEATLSDINQYGLLFQYDKKWQRKRACKQRTLCQMEDPCTFYALSQELQELSLSLHTVYETLTTSPCPEGGLADPCFAEQFRLLLDRVNCLHENLNLYQQKLSQDYYQKCYCH